MLLLSLTLVPILCAFTLKRGMDEKESLVFRASHSLYKPILQQPCADPGLVLVIAGVALLGSSRHWFPDWVSEFLPELNEGSIWVNFNCLRHLHNRGQPGGPQGTRSPSDHSRGLTRDLAGGPPRWMAPIQSPSTWLKCWST